MHVIRLRKPWTRIDAAGNSSRIDVPEPATSASVLASAEVIQYQRRFNLPSGLKPQTRVYLRISQWTGDLLCLQINDHELPVPAESRSLEIDITESLQNHNRLLVEIRGGASCPARLSGEVALAID